MNLKTLLSNIATEHGATEQIIEEAHLNAEIAVAFQCPDHMSPKAILEKDLPEEAVEFVTKYVEAVFQQDKEAMEEIGNQFREEWFRP